MRTPSRLLRRLSFSILGGLVLTVAAAWFAAAFLDVVTGELQTRYDDEKEPLVVPAYIGAPNDWHVRSWHSCWGPGVRYDLVSECMWMGSTLGMSEYTKPNRTMLRMTVGFPLPCMQWAAYGDDALPSGGDKNPWYTGLDLPGKQLIGKRVERALPLRPILWPTLANIAVGTALSYILIASLSAARAARRRRRGLCLRCGYHAAALPTCPECGTPTGRPGPTAPSG